MFDPADGAYLVVLVASFVATQLAVVWTLRDRLTAWQRWGLLIVAVAVAPFVVAMPALLVLVWIGLNLVTVLRGVPLARD